MLTKSKAATIPFLFLYSIILKMNGLNPSSMPLKTNFVISYTHATSDLPHPK